MNTLTPPTSEDFKTLLKSAGITRQEAADLLYASIHTVDSWANPEGAKNHRDMSLGLWELLLLKLNKHPTHKLLAI